MSNRRRRNNNASRTKAPRICWSRYFGLPLKAPNKDAKSSMIDMVVAQGRVA